MVVISTDEVGKDWLEVMVVLFTGLGGNHHLSFAFSNGVGAKLRRFPGLSERASLNRFGFGTVYYFLENFRRDAHELNVNFCGAPINFLNYVDLILDLDIVPGSRHRGRGGRTSNAYRIW